MTLDKDKLINDIKKYSSKVDKYKYYKQSFNKKLKPGHEPKPYESLFDSDENTTKNKATLIILGGTDEIS